MMSLSELTKFIVLGLVEDKDSVEIEEVNEDNSILINVKVSDSDMGKLIGRDGKIINSIRTIIQEASSLRDSKFVKVEVIKK